MVLISIKLQSNYDVTFCITATQSWTLHQKYNEQHGRGHYIRNTKNNTVMEVASEIHQKKPFSTFFSIARCGLFVNNRYMTNTVVCIMQRNS